MSENQIHSAIQPPSESTESNRQINELFRSNLRFALANTAILVAIGGGLYVANSEAAPSAIGHVHTAEQADVQAARYNTKAQNASGQRKYVAQEKASHFSDIAYRERSTAYLLTGAVSGIVLASAGLTVSGYRNAKQIFQNNRKIDLLKRPSS